MSSVGADLGLAFYRAVGMKAAHYLSATVYADININYSRSTAARMLPVALLWACERLLSCC